ncbi:hypothetical protein ACFVYC_05760 [Pseudarthrobacter sp. NPDC058329]|uniref:hypothetical protein n=1 Tax=Pseudarthrobacter sp. NPDC058329 TaxID=3346448 RepID=UPI0036DD4601
MGVGTGAAAAMEGIHTSVAGLDELVLSDARLDAAADGSGTAVDVLQRKIDIRLERLALMEAQLAGAKALVTWPY